MLEGEPKNPAIDVQMRNEIIRIVQSYIKFKIPLNDNRIKALEKLENEEFIREALEPFEDIVISGVRIDTEEIARNVFDLINMILGIDAVSMDEITFIPEKKRWMRTRRRQ
ncbi:MAG: hypothetical protein WC831_05765 [Parcubacteria group bacterium]|jgi:hypothetical protein